eukprot:scaffold6995_cov66-Attheya_sp.AAC.4
MENDERKGDEATSNLSVAMCAIMFIGMIFYLHSTFLPFARFVNGILKVRKNTKDFDEEECAADTACLEEHELCFCSFWRNAFPGVFTFIVRGLDGVVTTIDYLFVIVAGCHCSLARVDCYREQ